MTNACVIQATSGLANKTITSDLLLASYYRNHLESMLQTTTVAKMMMNATTHCLQHIHTNPKPNVNLHSHTNQKPTLHLSTAHS
jgi:hypothetical protein